MIQVGAVGLCQIHGTALALGHLLPDARVRVFEAPIVQAQGEDRKVAEYLAECDIVFSHWLAPESGELATMHLQQRIPDLRIVPLVIFDGYHPDTVYLEQGERKFRSPVGVYHSTIVASAFSLGYSADETETLFNRLVFGRLGYLTQFEASWSLMVADLSAHGYGPYLDFDSWCHNGPFMHSVNHPKVEILARVARTAAILAGLAKDDCPHVAPAYDWLAYDTVWPIYPEIAETLGVPGSYHFKRPSEITASGLVPVLRLPEFVRESFEIYPDYPGEVFQRPEIAAARQVLWDIRGPGQGRTGERARTTTRTRRSAAARSRCRWDADSYSPPPIKTQAATASMSLLPTDSLPAAEFIVRRMYRTVDLAPGERFSAVSETERPIEGDDWFWTDDNAKVLEFLSRPELWARYPTEIGEILQFVRSMCKGPFIFRRLSTPQLRQVAAEEGRASYRHSLLNIQADLARGGVTAGLRFHDERNFDNLLLCGNWVEFTYGGQRRKLPVEPAIRDTGAELAGQELRLRHVSELRLAEQGRDVEIGRLTYVYKFDARSLLIEAEVTLDIAAGVEIGDVTLTVGHDQLDRWFYAAVDADTRIGSAPLFSAGKPSRQTLDLAGASYYVLRQEHSSGDALALHSLPRDPGRLARIEMNNTEQGKLHHAVTCYSFPGTHRGGTSLNTAEHKLLTGGGLYDRVADYAGFLRDAVAGQARQQAAYDFSTSYDYGVVINAFAKCFATCAAVRGQPQLAELRDELKGLADRYLRHYLDVAVAGHRQGKNTVFSRELSFTILAAVTMYRATGGNEYLHWIRQFCEAQLDLEIPYTDVGGGAAAGFRMRVDAGPTAHVDCHSAALLALVQAAPLLNDRRLVEAIDRGLAAYVLDTSMPERNRFDGIGTLVIDGDGTRFSENAFWNFKIGLTMRLFAALRKSPDPAVRDVAAKHADRLDLLEAIMRRQLELSTVVDGNTVELRCAVGSGETNSETQPWIMLGLLGHPAD